MNRKEAFWYTLGIYRGESKHDDDYHSAYLTFIADIYDLFSGFGKIHQYFLDNIIELTINEDGDFIGINEDEIVDDIVEHFTYKINKKVVK